MRTFRQFQYLAAGLGFIMIGVSGCTMKATVDTTNLPSSPHL